MIETVADRIFAAQSILSAGEDDVIAALEQIGVLDLQRLAFDCYDRSFEAYSVTPFDIQPTPEQLGQVWALGFERFWLHRGDERVMSRALAEYERYFCNRGPA